jgi:hypothetical protein
LYVPVGVPDPTEIVNVDDPDPGAMIDVGLKLALAPDGKPETESAIDELNGPERVEVMLDEPELPWLIVTDCGDADNEKLESKVISRTACNSIPLGACPA